MPTDSKERRVLTRQQRESRMDALMRTCGIPVARWLDLARPMRMDVGRIGYDEEGIRLTMSIGSPYEFDAEVKLSRADAEWLVASLRRELDDPRNANLPKGVK